MKQTQETTQTHIEKTPKNWDITRHYLNRLLFYDIRDAYHGRFNIDVPDEMLDKSNPDEILAYHIAGKRLKIGNQHLQFPRDICQLIIEMNKTAYNLGFWKTINSRRFPPQGENGQQARLSSLSEESKQQFLESFFTQYRDEHFRDEELERQTYAARFYDFITKRFQTAHPELLRKQ